MTFIPENTVTLKDVGEWYNLKNQLSKVKAQEMLMRTRIYGAFFIMPTEGTNKVELADGYSLKAVRVITRDIDEAALESYREKFEEAKIPLSSLIKYKPSLAVAEYRKLTEEQMALFDNCLTIKDGSPSMELVVPKTK